MKIFLDSICSEDHISNVLEARSLLIQETWFDDILTDT